MAIYYINYNSLAASAVEIYLNQAFPGSTITLNNGIATVDTNNNPSPTSATLISICDYVSKIIPGVTPSGSLITGGGLSIVGPLVADSNGNAQLIANAYNIVNADGIGRFNLPPAIAGTVVAVLVFNNSNGSNVSIFSASGDGFIFGISSNNIQNDFLDYVPTIANNNPSGPLFILCPSNGFWYTTATPD